MKSVAPVTSIGGVVIVWGSKEKKGSEYIDDGEENKGGSIGCAVVGTLVLSVGDSFPSPKTCAEPHVRVNVSVSCWFTGGGELLKTLCKGDRTQSESCKVNGSLWRRAKDS